jgi:hypothetical protein
VIAQETMSEATAIERLDAMIAMPDAALASSAGRLADELLTIGETALESWVRSRGQTPTDAKSEGFRLLALHRQGARGEPSFNACRETCRELVYHRNLIALDPESPNTSMRLKMASLVAMHLLLFVSGKLEVEGLGEFCCSSRPLRAAGG